MYYDVAEYTSHFGAIKIGYTPNQYFSDITLGLLLAALASVGLAVIFGWIVFFGLVFSALWTLSFPG